MVPPDRRPPPLPDRRAVVGDEQPERRAVHHPGVDGVAQPPPKRSATLTGMPAPPPLPGELAPTLPAENPLRKRTWRIPTPPSALAVARRSDPPTSADPPAPTDAPESQPDASAELAAARLRIAQLERDARAAADARNVAGSFPPPVQRKPSPVPTSSSSPEAKVDKAIGAGVRVLLTKAAPYLLAAAGIGGGVTAVAKPTADPAKTDAVLASQEAMRADVALLREQIAGLIKREAARDQYTECLEEVLDDVGTQVLPAQDRLGAAAPLRAYIKQRCRRLRP